MERFEEILKDLILGKNLSLKMIAKESKVSATQYSKYIRGVSYPTVAVAVRIANYFNISLDCLFGLTDYENCYLKKYNISEFVKRYEDLLVKHNTTNWLFSKKYGLNESSLRRWKAGDIPNIHSLINIAKNLSTSIDYLVGRE